ncbi:MAG: DJ-1/PfpI family protein, partial [Dehalococcoidia bacterium]
MRLQDKKVAILVHNDFEDLELWYPAIRLREEGAEITLVGPHKGEEHKGKRGLTATADAGVYDVHPVDFDLVVIPGGYSPDHMRRVPEMVDFVRSSNEQGKMIAAICHAPWMLASAG